MSYLHLTFRRITAIGTNTLTELIRQKVFYFLLIFAVLIIGNSSLVSKFSFQEEFQMLKDVALGAMSVFLSMLAILTTAMLLPKDIEDRTIFTILSKPVHRFEYLLGKFLGVAILLTISTLVMAVFFFTVLLLREQSVLLETSHTFSGSPNDLAAALAQVKRSSFSWNLFPAITMILMKSFLLASLTLLISTFATSTIFTIIISISAYFIGHLQVTAREYWMNNITVEWWTRLFAAFVALLFPDLQAFNLNDAVVAGVAMPMSIFTQTLALALVYIAAYFSVSCFVFQNREL